MVWMVAEDGIPLRYFSSASRQKLLGEMAAKLKVSIDWNRIRDYLITASQNLKTKLKKDLKDKFMHLEFDYLGVNVRYVNNKNEAITETLTVTDTRSQHTSQELKILLHNILKEFEIPLKNVLCCVTDNASNMIKVVKDLNIDLAAELTPDVATGSEPDELESDSDEDEDICQEGEDENELMEELVTSLPDSIVHVRCGVHTLQLAIQDGLKNANAESMITRIRNLAIDLRTPKISEKVKKAGLRKAVLDQETRWGSTYLMVERVLELRGFVNEAVEIFNKNLQLTAQQWRQAQ